MLAKLRSSASCWILCVSRASRISLLFLLCSSQLAWSQPVLWATYRGDSGVVADFPSNIFVVDAGPTQRGVGHRLKSTSGHHEFAAYSLPRDRFETPSSYLRANLAVAPSSIAYQRVTPHFFALSSLSNGKIYYSRCNFRAAIHCIYLEYPSSEKNAWDGIVTRISHSLRNRND